MRRKNLKKFVDEHNESTTDRHRHRKNLLDLLMGYDSDESEDEFVEDDNGNLVLKRNVNINNYIYFLLYSFIKYIYFLIS